MKLNTRVRSEIDLTEITGGMTQEEIGSAILSATAEIPFITMLGQSPIAGAGDIADLAVEYQQTYADQKMWSGSAFVALDQSSDRAESGKFGPEWGLAAAAKAQNKELLLFKGAVGGSLLDNDPTGATSGSWLPDAGNLLENVFSSSGSYYIGDALTAAYEYAQSVGKTLKIYILWGQGEADSGGSRGAWPFYEKNLDELFAAFSSYLGFNPKIIHLSTDEAISSGYYTNVDDVREAQNNVADWHGNVFQVNADGYKLKSDNLHHRYPNKIARDIVWPLITGGYKYSGETPAAWSARAIVDAREQGVGGTPELTIRQGASAAIIAGTIHSAAYELTGKSAAGGRTVALATVDGISSETGIEVSVESVAGSAYFSGGPLFCATDLGAGVYGGYAVRLQANEMKLFKLLNGSSTQIGTTYSDTKIAIGKVIWVRAKVSAGVVSVELKFPGEKYTQVVSVADATYTSGGAGFVTGWSTSDESTVLFSNVRPI